MKALQLAPGLKLPADVAGEAVAILAKRGAGKTNTGRVLVEELVNADVQSVVLDPVGAWWGLRYSADGKSEGLPLPILGGQHGDVPLEQTAGALIADVVVDSGQSLVLDLSDFPSKGAINRFVTDFAERLFRRKARAQSLLHVVFEEADEFAPQKGRADTARMRGAIEQIVRRGRSRGLGVTLITQRSAVLNKDVLTQADVLIVMRTTGPQDQAAIKEWVASRADRGGDEVLPSLPSLATGEAWVWNPERDLLQRVQIRRSNTFDSGATPKAGQRRQEPKRAAVIDLDSLGEQIAATVERAKENDPAELRRRVTQLEREIARKDGRQAEKVVEHVEVRVEVPVFTREDRAALRAIAGHLGGAGAAIAEAERATTRLLDELEQRTNGHHAPTSALARPTAARSAPPKPASPRPIRPIADTGDDVQVKAGARRILQTLARHHPMRVTRAQLGTLARFKVTGGTFQTYFSQLKRLGLLEETGGEIQITDAGLDFIGHVAAEPQTTEELLEMWRGALKAGARNMLDVLVANYPGWLEKEQLAELVEMTVTGGTFQTYLSTLRRNGLADIDGAQVRASDTLFIAAGTA